MGLVMTYDLLSHPRERFGVGSSTKRIKDKYSSRRCGRMCASPKWLEYCNTYYLLRSALAHAEQRVLSRSPSAPKSAVFGPASRTGAVLVLEDPNGAPADRLLGRPLDVSHFLRIAIPLAGGAPPCA